MYIYHISGCFTYLCTYLYISNCTCIDAWMQKSLCLTYLFRWTYAYTCHISSLPHISICSYIDVQTISHLGSHIYVCVYMYIMAPRPRSGLCINIYFWKVQGNIWDQKLRPYESYRFECGSLACLTYLLQAYFLCLSILWYRPLSKWSVEG